MSNVVFILGAGTSKQSGAPLMKEFLDVAFDLWRTGAAAGKDEHFERVYRARAALSRVHSKAQFDQNNIESIFTALEIAKILGKLPGFPVSEIDQVIASLKEVIVTTLEQTMEFPVTGRAIGPPAEYAAFANLLTHLQANAFPTQTVSVITFNYDVGCDFALMLNGLGPSYCLDGGSARPSDVPLLKLHGSLNWASSPGKGGVKVLFMKSYLEACALPLTFEGSSTRMPIGSQLHQIFGANDVVVDPEPFIVPPTWNKGDHHRVLSAVWGRAAVELETAEYIYIIGYSLPETDAFFKLLYALGTAGETPLREIAVFDVDGSGQVENRFKALLGPGALARFGYHQKDFNNAILAIKNKFPRRNR